MSLSSRSVRAENTPYLLERSLHHAEKLLSLYPSETHFLLGFGVSTNTLCNALEVLTPPESRGTYFNPVPVTGLFQGTNFSDSQTLEILEKLVPPEAVLNGRALVFVRVLDRGWSLTVFHRRLAEFMKARRPNTPLKFHLIGGAFPAAFERIPGLSWGKKGARLVYDAKFSKAVTRAQNREAADSILQQGPYEPFGIGEVAESAFATRANPRHEQYVSEFRTALVRREETATKKSLLRFCLEALGALQTQ